MKEAQRRSLVRTLRAVLVVWIPLGALALFSGAEMESFMVLFAIPVAALVVTSQYFAAGGEGEQ